MRSTWRKRKGMEKRRRSFIRRRERERERATHRETERAKKDSIGEDRMLTSQDK